MRQPIVGVLVFAVMVCLVSPLLAHERYRIIGTITKFDKSQLEVKATKDGKIYKVTLDNLTVVRRDKEKVTTVELKAGRSVVVDALGDSLKDLVAVEIRLVPAATTAPPANKVPAATKSGKP